MTSYGKSQFNVLPSILIACILLSALQLNAQTIVRGTVTDADTGEPLLAVQVYADGTPAFTETDEKGNYELQIPYKKD